MNKADLSLTTGKIYKFKFRAINEKGNSEDSDVVRFALVDMPSPPLTISKTKSLSSMSSIHVSWTQSADETLPGGTVLGYKLYSRNSR